MSYTKHEFMHCLSPHIHVTPYTCNRLNRFISQAFYKDIYYSALVFILLIRWSITGMPFENNVVQISLKAYGYSNPILIRIIGQLKLWALVVILDTLTNGRVMFRPCINSISGIYTNYLPLPPLLFYNSSSIGFCGIHTRIWHQTTLPLVLFVRLPPLPGNSTFF